MSDKKVRFGMFNSNANFSTSKAVNLGALLLFGITIIAAVITGHAWDIEDSLTLKTILIAELAAMGIVNLKRLGQGIFGNGKSKQDGTASKP